MEALSFILVVLLVVVLIGLALTGIYRTAWGPWVGIGGFVVVAVVCVLLATGRV